jgi:uncharacterized phage protein gp47/JayE
VTAAGLTIPSYSDIQQSLLSAYQAIYGSNTYLGNDSADYQWVSSVALKLFDNMSLCQLTYNSRSPVTAIGSALDAIVKLNGIRRIAPTYSTVTVVLNGTAGTQILYGVLQDVNGVQWSLPNVVTIGPAGNISSVATCNQAGAINAAPGTVNTPVGGFSAGWTSVTNPSSASVGTVPESDSQLRARQAVAVATPSNTRLEGTEADIEAISGVKRTNILENQLSVTDSLGNQSHSLTCVVEGGDQNSIALAIYNNKGIGANTLGGNPSASQVTVPVTDPNTGNITTIGLYRPSYVTIFVTLNIHDLLTGNYNSTMQANIISAVTNYLGNLQIGEIVTQSALYGVALSVMADLTKPDFSIKALFLGKTASPTGTADIPMNFWEVAQAGTVTITPV